MDPDNCVSRAEFNLFCDEQYPPGFLSKTMRHERCDRIVGWLKGVYPPPRANWRIRLVNKGYTLVSFPNLGLQDVLCLKGIEQDGQIEQGVYGEWRKVVSVEEFYDVLLDTHVRIQNHGGYKPLMKALEASYVGIPRVAILKFVALCSVCRKNPRQQLRAPASISTERVVRLDSITRDFNRRCQIDVLDMTQTPDGQYTHIGVFTDHWTKLITLFPMTGHSPQHVAYGLASSVYPYYGPPHFLHATEGLDFAAEVVRLSIDKWKGGERTVVPQPKGPLMHMEGVVGGTRDALIDLINTRAVHQAVQGHIPWASWLGKIMFDINNRQSTSTGKSSYKRVFERTIVSDCSKSDDYPASSSGDQTGSGSDSKRKRRQSPTSDDGNVVLTSYQSPSPVAALKLKRPSTFVAIEHKR